MGSSPRSRTKRAVWTSLNRPRRSPTTRAFAISRGQMLGTRAAESTNRSSTLSLKALTWSSKHHVRVTEASTTKSTSATAGLDQLTDPYVPQGVAAAGLPEGRDHRRPIAPPALCRAEHGDWYPMLRDSEGAPGGDFVQQPRKVRLGFVGPHSLHEIR